MSKGLLALRVNHYSFVNLQDNIKQILQMLLAVKMNVIKNSKSEVDTHVRTQTKIVTMTAVRTATRVMWQYWEKHAVKDFRSSTAPKSAQDTWVKMQLYVTFAKNE